MLNDHKVGSEVVRKTMIGMLTDDEAGFANLWTMTVAKYVVLGMRACDVGLECISELLWDGFWDG